MSVECIAVSILALPPCWHVAGVKARKYVTEARLSVGRMLNCDAEGKRIIVDETRTKHTRTHTHTHMRACTHYIHTVFTIPCTFADIIFTSGGTEVSPVTVASMCVGVSHIVCNGYLTTY